MVFLDRTEEKSRLDRLFDAEGGALTKYGRKIIFARRGTSIGTYGLFAFLALRECAAGQFLGR